MKKSLLCLFLFILSGCGATITGTSAAFDRRNIDQHLSDRALALHVKSRLYQHPDVYDKSNITVTVADSNVLLTGEIANEMLREKAAYLAATTEGTKKVYNFIAIDHNTSAWQDTRDAWITTKIQTQFLTTRAIDPSAIHITTENNTVFLMGNVSEEEGYKATELARQTQGVKKVVAVFQYINIDPLPRKKTA